MASETGSAPRSSPYKHGRCNAEHNRPGKPGQECEPTASSKQKETAAVTYLRHHSTPFQLKHVACLLHCDLEDLKNHLGYVAIHTCNLRVQLQNMLPDRHRQTHRHTDILWLRGTFVLWKPRPTPPRPASAPCLHLTHPVSIRFRPLNIA